MLPFGGYIIGFWTFVIVILISIIPAFIMGWVGCLIKEELLWKTPTGCKFSSGGYGTWPWWLKTDGVMWISATVGFVTTIYALIGPYIRFMIWIK